MEKVRSAIRADVAFDTTEELSQPNIFSCTLADGSHLTRERLVKTISWASRECSSPIDTEAILEETMRNIFENISTQELAEALILAASSYIEQDPGYSFVASRLLFKKLFKEVTTHSVQVEDFQMIYQQSFVTAIKTGVDTQIYDARMLDFDLTYLAEHIMPERDLILDYMGLKTLYERYFVKAESVRIELPQTFWMRIAMGLSYNEPKKNERAVEFYEAMSRLYYVPSTPTLLHASLTCPQLSSCFLTTVEDDLTHIFKCLSDNAFINRLSQYNDGLIPFIHAELSSDQTTRLRCYIEAGDKGIFDGYLLAGLLVQVLPAGTCAYQAKDLFLKAAQGNVYAAYEHALKIAIGEQDQKLAVSLCEELRDKGSTQGFALVAKAASRDTAQSCLDTAGVLEAYPMAQRFAANKQEYEKTYREAIAREYHTIRREANYEQLPAEEI
jgi:hypothetical protein